MFRMINPVIVVVVVGTFARTFMATATRSAAVAFNSVGILAKSQLTSGNSPSLQLQSCIGLQYRSRSFRNPSLPLVAVHQCHHAMVAGSDAGFVAEILLLFVSLFPSLTAFFKPSFAWPNQIWVPYLLSKGRKR
uniref:Uncharacterized protein n=1 Tax=Nelumbo nucifera TaxID=4432 RepID=A0A822YG31_NELNU|nr:TPA_asm: hypothetical protein HUJ06_010298 [Nelumbo nucifera]